MTIDKIISRLRDISKWYQMMGDEVAVIERAIDLLEMAKNDGVVHYMGKTYIAKNPIFKTIDSQGICGFYGFKKV